jgi:dihydroorotase
MNPPLRTEEDRQALVAGLRDGTIDCIATDHAPHTPDEKDREFDYAPNGVIGLETALPVALAVLMREHRFRLARVVDLLTRRPAALLGLEAGSLAPDAPADICLFDPEESWRYDARAGASKSRNSPWHDRILQGRVAFTLGDGRIVFRRGQIIGD